MEAIKLGGQISSQLKKLEGLEARRLVSELRWEAQGLQNFSASKLHSILASELVVNAIN